MDLTKNRRPAATAPRFRALWSRLVPRRGPRPERVPEPPAPAELAGALRAFRAAALWAIATVVATADGAAFSESYRGLFDWAGHHDFSGFWAAAFPLQVDLFIVLGELVLFIAMTDRWSWRDRLGAWAVAGLGLAVSVAGNIGHTAAHDLQSRGTAAVPPLAAFGGLWLGLGVLKRILKYGREQRAQVPAVAETAAGSALAESADDLLRDVLGGLTGAVLLLAERGANPPLPPAPDTAQAALLAELLEAVRGIGGGAVPVPVPADAESAARMAMEATLAAGNPLSLNQLQTRYGLTRAQATKVREASGADTIRYAVNGTPAGG